jgi:hypothetical protein
LEPLKWAGGEMLREWGRDVVTATFLRDLRMNQNVALTSLRRLAANQSASIADIRGASVRLEVLEELIQAIEEAGKVRDADE